MAKIFKFDCARELPRPSKDVWFGPAPQAEEDAWLASIAAATGLLDLYIARDRDGYIICLCGHDASGVSAVVSPDCLAYND